MASVLVRRVRVLFAGLLSVGLLAPLAPMASAQSFLTLHSSGYASPVFVTHAGDSRLFVVQRDGYIKVYSGGSVSTFLDIHTLISLSGERGLLGLAFHPDYNASGMPGTGRFYVYYARPSDGAIVIREYQRSSGNPNAANPNSGRNVIVIPHPTHNNHYGGWMGFRPGTKDLYVAIGDGGGQGDPNNNAQNLNVLLGKILRINPLQSGARAYTIPASNPFVGVSGRDEIWSYGLRNPWRCSFDRSTRYLWCGDVGQFKWEEIDRHPDGKGRNFGWRLLEGRHYYNWPGHTSGALCTSGCKTRPIAEYAHSVSGTDNCSVTGGYVSRRSGAPLNGRYLVGDFCSGRIWSISANFASGSSLPAASATSGFPISCFGEGMDGRIYVCDLQNGRIYRVTNS